MPRRRRQQHVLICIECGEEFRAARRDAAYCSDRCRQRVSRRRRKVERKPTVIEEMWAELDAMKRAETLTSLRFW